MMHAFGKNSLQLELLAFKVFKSLEIGSYLYPDIPGYASNFFNYLLDEFSFLTCKNFVA